MAEGSSCNLLEAMAAGIVDICFRHDRVEVCGIRVEKPEALRFAKGVRVEIER